MRAHRWRTLVLAGAALLAAGAARADDPAAAGVFRPPDTWQGGAATLTLGLDPDDEADTVLTHGFRHRFFHHGHFHFYRPSFALSYYRGFYPRYYGGFYGYPYYYPRYHRGLSFSFAIYPRYSYYPGFYSYPWYSYYPSYYYPRYSYYPSYGYYPGYSLSYYSYGYC
ncbi:MAG TPA: hypothetical protein VIL46_14680, partial [Gemmataceae bacterium]